MDGWMTCDQRPFRQSFMSYQDDERMIKEGFVQWNPVYGYEEFVSSGAGTQEC